MKKQLIKVTTTAILASSMVGCGFGKAKEQSDDLSGNGVAVVETQLDSPTSTGNPAVTTEKDDKTELTEKSTASVGSKVKASIPAPKYTQESVANASEWPSTPEEAYLNNAVAYVAPVTSGNQNSTKPTNNVPELSPYQKELNRLDAEIVKAANLFTTAKAAYEKAKGEYDGAVSNLKEISGYSVDDKNAIEMAKVFVGAKKAALEIAKQTLDDAEEEYKDIILQSKTDFELKEAAAAAVMTDKKQLAQDTYDLAISEAEEEYKAAIATAQTVYNEEVNAAKAIKDTKDAAAEAKYDAAIKEAGIKYNNATAEARAVQDATNAEAKRIYDENVANAQNEYDTAVFNAEHTDSYLSAVQNLSDATQVQIEAVEAKVEAEANLADAKDELALAVSEKEAQDAVVEDKKAAKEQAERELANAEALLATYQKTLENATINDETAKRNVALAEQAVAEAQTRKSNAEDELETANEALTLAAERITNAENAVADAQSQLDTANEEVAKGVLGFYEYRLAQGDADAQTAIDILTYASSDAFDETIRTDIGAEGDATSLENVLKVFDYIREGNDLAENDPNFPDAEAYGVTYRLMAIAEANANISSYTGNHASKNDQNLMDKDATGYKAGENAAWGFTGDAYTQDSPYRGWYDAEKPIYDEYLSKNRATATGSGHYTNITGNTEGDKNTGFAINTETDKNSRGYKKSKTYIQTFSWLKGNDQAYSVDEYEAMFLEYYNTVMSAVDQAKAVLSEKQEVLADLQSRNGLTVEEKQAIDDATAAVEEANAVLATANTLLSNANLDAEKKAEALTEAQMAVNDQTTVVATEQNEYDQATLELSDAEILANEKGEIVIAREGDVTDAENDLDDATGDLDKANQDKADAEATLENEKQRVVDETADEKQALEDAENDDIVEKTAVEAQNVYDETTADAKNALDAETADAENTRANEKTANADEYNASEADASKTLTDATNAADTTRTGKEADALNTKTAAETDAQNVYDSTVADAKATQNATDAAALDQYNEVKENYAAAEGEYNDAVVIDQSVNQTFENVEATQTNVETAEAGLVEAETNKDKFVNPGKYVEKIEAPAEAETPTENTEEKADGAVAALHTKKNTKGVSNTLKSILNFFIS